jgi:WD40 repeat protein/uncharacterized caspase-like protein
MKLVPITLAGRALKSRSALAARAIMLALIVGSALGLSPAQTSTPSQARRPELVLQTGLTSPAGGVAFSADGRVLATQGAGNATSVEDKIAKLWDVETGRLLNSVTIDSGGGVNTGEFPVALSPDGKWIASANSVGKATTKGVDTKTKVTLWEVASGRKVRDFSTPDTKTGFGATQYLRRGLAFSPDGQWLTMSIRDKSSDASALSALDAPGRPSGSQENRVQVWEVASGREVKTLTVTGASSNRVIDQGDMPAEGTFALSHDRRLLASASNDRTVRLVDMPSGNQLHTLAGHAALIVRLAFSPDGRLIASSSADNTSKLWDAASGRELHSVSLGAGKLFAGGAFSPDGRQLASGGYDNTIKVWDALSGRELRTLGGHSGPVSALDFSPDGKLLVSGSEDGSARVWSPQTGETLATIITLNKGADWLVVTPDGLFDGSPAAWDHILWRFSQNTLDVSPVEIFFHEFYHPGLLTDVLAGRKVMAAADITEKDRRQPELSMALADGQAAAGVQARDVKVKINITNAPAGAQDLRLFRNGSLVKLWRGDVLKDQAGAALEAVVPVIAGENRLTAYAFNRDNVKSADATLTVRGADGLKRSGTAYILGVGVNDYANPEYNLKYAVADVQAFAEEVKRQQASIGRFDRIEVVTLINAEATKANILHALDRFGRGSGEALAEGAPASLAKIRPAEPEDLVIVYYAGHGTARQQRFYLIPHDLGYQGKRTSLDEEGLNAILSHSVSDLEMERAFERVDAGQLMMVIDACNSGQALEAEEKRRGPMNSKGLAQLAYEKGMYILTAAQSYQAALEAEQLGHGYLTYTLVEEGLKTSAADSMPKDSQVIVREWLDYAAERVPQMQRTEMQRARELKHKVAFVEGEEKIEDPDKRSLQRPRVFYRREMEPQPLVVAKPGAN